MNALKLGVLTQEGSERSNKEQSCLVCLGSLELWSSTRTDWKSAEESLQLGEGGERDGVELGLNVDDLLHS